MTFHCYRKQLFNYFFKNNNTKMDNNTQYKNQSNRGLFIYFEP